MCFRRFAIHDYMLKRLLFSGKDAPTISLTLTRWPPCSIICIYWFFLDRSRMHNRDLARFRIRITLKWERKRTCSVDIVGLPDIALIVSWSRGQFVAPPYLRPEAVTLTRLFPVSARWLSVLATYLEARIHQRHPSEFFGVAQWDI